MKDGPNIARIAALIGDPARAEILTALMADRALTATELAEVAGITKQTVSAHLAKLLEAQLIAVAQQGRHRYFRLAGADIAQLLEALMGVAFRTGAVRLRNSPREPALRKARICYDHLAGELGVKVYEALLQQGALQEEAGQLMLSEHGRAWFVGLGIDVAALVSQRRHFCRPCLDWGERRHHLAGALGSALLQRIENLGWARRQAGSRVIRFEPHGERALLESLSAIPSR
ncbi:winged helix-turn-helix domain-containing protein [Chitinimonas sp.]|uniref:ArsR/SmtB family transcription factor n=1 Tax=Chitinimonas sp. TaxID=1934313 RepID=UPI002F9201BE